MFTYTILTSSLSNLFCITIFIGKYLGKNEPAIIIIIMSMVIVIIDIVVLTIMDGDNSPCYELLSLVVFEEITHSDG